MLETPDYQWIARALKDGNVVLFLGAGVSAASGLPSGHDLAERLVVEGRFPDAEGREDLALVASYLVNTKDTPFLKSVLRQLLTVHVEPCDLHHCIAQIKQVKLIVTTNYDDLIERAMNSLDPWIVVDRGKPGNVWYRRLSTEWKEIEAKNLGYEIDHVHPIIFKMHGSLDYLNKENDSFLITEEDYVDFLGRGESGQLPQMITTMMKQKNFLFLGYRLKDWNVRVLLRKLALSRNPAERIQSWAIVRKATEAEKRLWDAQNVDMYELPISDFVNGLTAALSRFP